MHFQSQKDILVYSWKAYFFSRKLLQKKKYDLSHSFFSVPCGFISLLLKQQYGLPYIVSLRGSDVPGYSERFTSIYRLLTPVIKYIWKKAGAVISNSEGLKELALQARPSQEIGLIYNGIDIEQFRPMKNKVSDKFVLLCTSRLTTRKGIDYLIRAAAILIKKKYPIQVELVGEGNDQQFLEDLAKELGIEKDILFKGRMDHDDMPKAYSQADVFVLPSLNEGMSNTMLEALASGLPLVATDTGGTKELVTDGQNGFIIKMKDAQDLAEKVEKIILDKELCQKMGEESRKKAEAMSWKNVADKYLEYYKNTDRVVVKVKKTKRAIFKFIVALGFIAWLLHRVNWNEVLLYFRQMDAWWMVAFVLVYAFGVGISAYKWKVLANFRKMKMSFFDFFKAYLTGAFINNFLPSIIGGDAYRSYYLGKNNGKKYLEAASTVLVDRISGFFGIMLLILICSLLSPGLVFVNPIFMIVDLGIVAIFAASFSLLIVRELPLWSKVKRFIPEKIRILLQEIRSFNQFGILSKAALLGAAFNFIGVGLASWMLFLDLHIPITFVNFVMAISVVSIVSSIPVSIGNIGIKEWAFMTIFGIFAVDGEAAISIAIFGRFLQMTVTIFAIPFYLHDKKAAELEAQE